ncbi:hypothetical protein ACF1BP_28660 [Streptomyces sp. NPDC014735]|uniref:hypothetical protein n=1 Tax=unclassified Streptomyces TaxID=2593676 RepID=UPI0037026204
MSSSTSRSSERRVAARATVPKTVGRPRHRGPGQRRTSGLLLIAANPLGLGLVGVQTFTHIQAAAVAAEDTFLPGV